MIRLRLIDQRGQMILMILSVFSMPVLLIIGLLFGLLILGPWQLLSAAFNTSSFIRNGLQKHIIRYWKWSAIILSLMFLTFAATSFIDADDLQLMGIPIIIGSFVIAIYYMSIYNDLIVHLKLRNELSGLLKS
jgi:hypothetical protein